MHLLFLLPIVNSEFIDMTVCSDLSCSRDCVSWTSESGICSPCNTKRGLCSSTNPSSITTINKITFYSDSVCKNVISGYSDIPIVLNNNCNTLIASGTTIGSYRSANLSLVIGLTIAIISVSVFVGCVCCLRYKVCCYRQTQNQEPLPLPYLSNNSAQPQYYPQPNLFGPSPYETRAYNMPPPPQNQGYNLPYNPQEQQLPPQNRGYNLPYNPQEQHPPQNPGYNLPQDQPYNTVPNYYPNQPIYYEQQPQPKII